LTTGERNIRAETDVPQNRPFAVVVVVAAVKAVLVLLALMV